MGYLTYGALAGASQEWLKQSEEQRKEGYQEIRDRRLSEIRKEEATFGQELMTTENIRQEGVAAKVAKTKAETEAGVAKTKAETEAEAAKLKYERDLTMPFDTSAGSRTSRLVLQPDGTYKVETLVDQPKTFAPTETSLKQQMVVYRRGPGGRKAAATTFEDLAKDWEREVYVEERGVDELGNPVTIKKRRPKSPELTEYYNSRVIDANQLEPTDARFLQRDPKKLWEFYKQQPEFKAPGGVELALEAMAKLGFGWWDPEMETEKGYITNQGGEAGPGPDAGRVAEPVDTPIQGAGAAPAPAAPTTPTESGASTSGKPPGMLEQGAKSLRQRAEERAARIQAEKDALDREEERLYKLAATGDQAAVREYAEWRKKHNR